MDDLKKTIADNIAFYRKELGLTQVELAEKLNYSDKAVSKWERAESYPDIATLVQLAKLFGITVDRLISNKKKLKKNRPLIALLASGLVWLIATAVYVILNMIFPGFSYSWFAFIYAVPVCSIVLLVLFAIWDKKFLLLITESVIMWSIATCIFLTLTSLGRNGAFYIFFLPIPLQILAILWYCKLKTKGIKFNFMRHRVRNSKNDNSNDNTSQN